MRIYLSINDLQSGGAERVLTNMANYWAEKGHDVAFIVLSDAPSFYELHPKITIFHPSFAKSRNFFIRNIKQLHFIWSVIKRQKRAEKPDILIGFMTENNVRAVIASRLTHTPLIISERSNPAYNYLEMNALWLPLSRFFYRFANCLVVQTKATRQLFHDLKFPLPPTEVVANPLNNAFVNYSGPLSKEKIILSVGRLSPEKGHKQLIEAFSQVKTDNWVLHIAGDGVLRQTYQDLIDTLNLSNRVKLLGNQANLVSIYARSAIFVLPSLYEGFPNALCEAMSMGCAPISFDCQTGPSDIILDGVNGKLVEPQDIDALATAMQTYIDDDALRKKIGKEARNIKKRLSNDVIMAQWDAILAKYAIKL